MLLVVIPMRLRRARTALGDAQALPVIRLHDLRRRCCVGEEETVSLDGGAVQMARESSVKLASIRWPGSVSKPSS